MIVYFQIPLIWFTADFTFNILYLIEVLAVKSDVSLKSGRINRLVFDEHQYIKKTWRGMEC
jgi:hypothetical protein